MNSNACPNQMSEQKQNLYFEYQCQACLSELNKRKFLTILKELEMGLDPSDGKINDNKSQCQSIRFVYKAMNYELPIISQIECKRSLDSGFFHSVDQSFSENEYFLPYLFKHH